MPELLIIDIRAAADALGISPDVMRDLIHATDPVAGMPPCRIFEQVGKKWLTSKRRLAEYADEIMGDL